jgi:hypothetical protein
MVNQNASAKETQMRFGKFTLYFFYLGLNPEKIDFKNTEQLRPIFDRTTVIHLDPVQA